jgi:hypothetical protein
MKILDLFTLTAPGEFFNVLGKQIREFLVAFEGDLRLRHFRVKLLMKFEHF